LQGLFRFSFWTEGEKHPEAFTDFIKEIPGAVRGDAWGRGRAVTGVGGAGKEQGAEDNPDQ
jgi:hypothetical protein